MIANASEHHPLAAAVRAQTGYPVYAADEIPSTNTALRAYASEALARGTAPTPCVLISRAQTAGRGRMGRSFSSVGGVGLYMSVLLTPACAADGALLLTTAAAAAAASAVDAVRTEPPMLRLMQDAGGTPLPGQAQIKWVNDIYLADHKVSGILTEAALYPGSDRLSYAVVGIGINLLPPPGGYGADLLGIAGALFARARADAYVPDSILGTLAGRIAEGVTRYFEMGDAGYTEVLEIYRCRSLLDGRAVLVRPASSLGGEEIPAVVCGIDDSFGLRVRYEDGTTAVLSSGEVVLCGGKDTLQSARATVHLQ